MEDENDLASALMNRGVVYRDRQELDAALADYNQAIAIRQRLLAAGRLPDENDLAGALMNRGNAYGDRQELDAALADYNQAIAIRQRLLAAGRLLDENDLAGALMNRGVVEILEGARDLTVKQIRAIAERFHVSPGVFI